VLLRPDAGCQEGAKYRKPEEKKGERGAERGGRERGGERGRTEMLNPFPVIFHLTNVM
jgi:hypothetical protein